MSVQFLWCDPIKRIQATYELKPSMDALVRGVGKNLVKVKDIINAKYPQTDVYRSHYDGGAVQRLITLQERQSEFLNSIEGAVYNLNTIGNELSAVADTVEALRSDFFHYMGILIDVEQHISDKLSNTIDILRHPARTRAFELRGDAVECWKDQLQEEAVRKMEQSKEHYDFDSIPYKFLGSIYLLEPEFKDFKKAQANFEMAYRYFRPKSTALAAEVKYLLGATYWAQGMRNEAMRETEQSIQIMPNYSEAKYQLAEFSAMTGHPIEAIELLDQATKVNLGYFRKAMMDESFDSMRKELNDYLGKLFLQHKKQADAKVTALKLDHLGRAFGRLIHKVQHLQKEARDLADTQMICSLVEQIRQGIY